MADKDKDGEREASALVVGQVVEAIRQEKQGQINVNILIQQVSEKSNNPEEIITQTERVLELAEKWEARRVQAFRDRVDAIVEAKTKDPDEIQKRQSNKVRRGLKVLLGFIAPTAILGGIAVAAIGGNIIVVALLLLIGVVTVAMLGPLASGESVSASDVVQIIQAAGNLVPKKQQQQQQQQQPPQQQGRRR